MKTEITKLALVDVTKLDERIAELEAISFDEGMNEYVRTGMLRALKEVKIKFVVVDVPSICKWCDGTGIDVTRPHEKCGWCYGDGKQHKSKTGFGNKDGEHLSWIYHRMLNVHQENENYDYMLKFKSIIKALTP